jgi:hypothetical protein
MPPGQETRQHELDDLRLTTQSMVQGGTQAVDGHAVPGVQ